MPVRLVATVAATAAATAAGVYALNSSTAASVKQALEECADQARTDVLLRHGGHFKGPIPTARECKEMTADEEGRNVTWAIRLGLEMHELALQCAEAKLKEMGLRVSIKPRYRFNRETGEKSLLSHEEKVAMLRKGGAELKGSLEPDVVVHTGDPSQVRAVYDFKFRCVNFDQQPEWRVYPSGHRYEGALQGDIYKEAFGPEVHLIGPRKGVFW